MKILITNDDGIESEGILRLAEWAKKLGSVVLCAPKFQQSGKSHGIEIHDAFEIKKVDSPAGVPEYSVDSTPADCVRYAVLGLKEQFDLVLSGINRGYNIGEDIVYSGTAGAVFEARALKIRAIAFSTDVHGFDNAVSHLDEIYGYMSDNGLFEHGDLFNVNIPGNDFKGIKITRQGDRYYQDEFVREDGDYYRQLGGCIYARRHAPDDDTEAVLSGYASITPLTVDRTDVAAFAKLKSLGL